MRLTPTQYPLGLQRRARAEYASPDLRGGQAHAEGVIVAYIDRPSYVIVTGEGRTVPWRCDLTDVGESVDEEEYYRHANARRLRDGRDSVRPELRKSLPGDDLNGSTLLEIVESVIAAGWDLNDVEIEADYDGEITLSEREWVISTEFGLVDRRDPEQVARLEHNREQRRIEEDQKAEELEAFMDDPLKGW